MVAGRGSTVLQKISIKKSKGSNVVSADMNVLERNKNLVQPSFDQIEDNTSFQRDDQDLMQDTLRTKSGQEQCRISVDSAQKIAEKRSLDGKTFKETKQVHVNLTR